MAMQIAGQPGAPAASTPPGVPAILRTGNLNELIVQELHGRSYEGAYRGTRFGAANQAGVATTAAFATTYTGLGLANPNGSGVNLVLDKVGLASIVAQTSALAVGLMIGQSTTALSGVTALTGKSKKVGSGIQPVGVAFSAATLPVAPTLDTVLGLIGTGAVTTVTELGGVFDLNSELLLPPGGFVCLYTNAASVAASLIGSLSWEEIPV